MTRKNKKKYTINYSEGDCFVFPLEGGGFARGVVVRMDHDHGLLGYFYGPRLREQNDALVTEDLTPENAVYIHMCGDLGLVDEEYGWKVIGKIPNWKREDWPMPVFGCVVEESRDWAELRWFDESTLEMTKRQRVTIKEVKDLPGSGLGGCGFIENYVSKILREKETDSKK